MAATAFDVSLLLSASALEIAKLAVLLHIEEVLKLELPSDLNSSEMVQLLRTMATQKWSGDLHLFCCELHVV